MADVSSDCELQLSGIFPVEVWNIILLNVNESQSFQKISCASPFLRSLLHPLRTQVLFPDVLRVLSGHQAKPRTRIRKVCRTWKNGLDKMLETQVYFFQECHEKMRELKGLAFRDVLKHPKFLSVGMYAEFEHHFDDTHLANSINPFLGKKAELRFDHIDAVPQPCFQLSSQILQKYGHNLNYCVISLFLDRGDRILFYNRELPNILRLMPNLRGLQICDARGLGLQQYFTYSSFQSLPHLNYISVGAMPAESVMTLLQENPQLRYVDAINSRPEVVSLFLELLPNLITLAFTISKTDQLATLNEVQFSSQVERLWIIVTQLTNVSFQQVFLTIESKFSTSLTELHLALPDRIELEKNFTMTLPHLKTFHLEMGYPQRLDFLFPVKETLERLYLALRHQLKEYRAWFEEVGSEERPENFTRIQLYKFWKEPQKSNIWRLFPQLKLLQTKTFSEGSRESDLYSCTRNEWNMAQAV